MSDREGMRNDLRLAVSYFARALRACCTVQDAGPLIDVASALLSAAIKRKDTLYTGGDDIDGANILAEAAWRDDKDADE